MKLSIYDEELLFEDILSVLDNVPTRQPQTK